MEVPSSVFMDRPENPINQGKMICINILFPKKSTAK